MPSGIYQRSKKEKERLKELRKRFNLGFKKGNQFSKNRKGISPTIEHRKKIGLANSIALKGRKLTEKTKRKMSESHKGKHIGEKNNQWKGGISFIPYTTDWTETLKRSIRERDHYTCQLCGKEPAIDVHHIDYDKKNCSPENLITLCHSCHTKTNTNRRYWIKQLRIIHWR